MIDLGNGCENQPVALLSQPKGELLVLIEPERRIKTGIGQEDITAVRCTVRVDEIDGLDAGHPVVTILVLKLSKARDHLALSSEIGAFCARHVFIGERHGQGRDPTGHRRTVGIGEEQQIAAPRRGAGVPRCAAGRRSAA